jgi:hypothetical protein
MKPSFALNLTEQGVTLLHRTARGWRDLGHAAFDNADLPAALDELRAKALALAPKGLSTKLVIPNSQILYAQIDAPGPDEASRRAQIETSLQGRTPYAVADLVYDWHMQGSTAHVAVVARETLAEAEGFATEHGFNPMAFVAIPDAADAAAFAGEPFFGPSSLAPSLLRGKQTLERDDAAISLINRDKPKAAATDAAENPPQPQQDQLELSQQEHEPSEPEQPENPAPHLISDPAPEPGPVPTDDPVSDAVPDPITDPVQDPDPVPARDPISDPVQDPDPVPARDPIPEPVQDPDPVPARDPISDPVQDPVSVPADDPIAPTLADLAPARRAPASAFPALQSGTRTLSLPELDEAPMAVDVPDEDDATTPPASTRPEPLGASRGGSGELPPALSAAALLAFASRRGADSPAPARDAVAAGSGFRGTGPATNAAPPLRAVQGPATTVAKPSAAKPTVDRPSAARPAPKFSYDDPVPPPPRVPGDPPGSQGTAMGKAGKGLRTIGAMVSAMPAKTANKSVLRDAPPAFAPKSGDAASNVAALRPNMPTTTTRPPQGAVRPDALARGLSARSMTRTGKPRFLGLILTGILLLVLAVVAAWSSYYLTQRDQTDPVAVAVVDAAAPPDIVEEGAPILAAPTGSDNVAPDPITPETLPAATTVTGPAPQTGLDSLAADATPPASRLEDEVFLAGMDPPPARSGPSGLADPTVTSDALPSPQMPPPPFGTVYTFDANGLIEPTVEGIVTPDGVRLVAGPPPRLPPARPAAIEAAAAPVNAAPGSAPLQANIPLAAGAEPALPAAADVAVVPAQTFQADSSLSDARPRVRPPELAPPPAAVSADPADDAALVTAEDSRIVSLRPRVRPVAILAAGDSARIASQSASLAANAASEAAIIEASASLSPQAVLVSRVPAPRPRNISRAVEAAVAAASRQTTSRPAPEPQGKALDEADDEPEVATAAPRIPTRASVAKQATFVNAINLSKVNLIGVYGSQSRRYALIRQANGRYKKVSVGDKIDGGRVEAITASEVRYQKGGRLIALALPKG